MKHDQLLWNSPQARSEQWEVIMLSVYNEVIAYCVYSGLIVYSDVWWRSPTGIGISANADTSNLISYSVWISTQAIEDCIPHQGESMDSGATTESRPPFQKCTELLTDSHGEQGWPKHKKL